MLVTFWKKCPTCGEVTEKTKLLAQKTNDNTLKSTTYHSSGFSDYRNENREPSMPIVLKPWKLYLLQVGVVDTVSHSIILENVAAYSLDSCTLH